MRHLFDLSDLYSCCGMQEHSPAPRIWCSEVHSSSTVSWDPNTHPILLFHAAPLFWLSKERKLGQKASLACSSTPPRSGNWRTVKHFWQRKPLNQIYDELLKCHRKKTHQNFSICFTLINPWSFTLESYCVKKQRNYMLTTLHPGIANITEMLLPGFENIHSCMITCTTTASSSQTWATATPTPALLNYWDAP